MLLLRWVWGNGENQGEVAPEVVFWTLRVLMFVLSFVLEDWAIHELVPSPRHRRLAMLLVSSSYVTWTFQTHTFSNSVETLLVAWSLVLIRRILEDGKVCASYSIAATSQQANDPQQRSSIIPSAVFGFLVALGVFNRITFPAFILVPSLQLLPHFWSK
jgi:phosphatidylinositol glycan class Z